MTDRRRDSYQHDEPEGYFIIDSRGRVDYLPNFDHPDNQWMLIVMAVGVMIALVVGVIYIVYDFLFVGTIGIRLAVCGAAFSLEGRSSSSS